MKYYCFCLQTVKLQLAKQDVIDKPDEDNQQVKQHKNTLNQIGQQIAEQMEELKYESEGIMDEEMLQT